MVLWCWRNWDSSRQQFTCVTVSTSAHPRIQLALCTCRRHSRWKTRTIMHFLSTIHLSALHRKYSPSEWHSEHSLWRLGTRKNRELVFEDVDILRTLQRRRWQILLSLSSMFRLRVHMIVKFGNGMIGRRLISNKFDSFYFMGNMV